MLSEFDLNSSAVTTFTVIPKADVCCRVRIETVWPGAGGSGGFFARLFAPRVLRPISTDELGLLDRYTRERASTDK